MENQFYKPNTNAYTGIRALLCFSIVIHHIYLTFDCFKDLPYIFKGSFAVNVFFVLSGFLINYNHGKNVNYCDCKWYKLPQRGLACSLSHTKKFYYLYILTIIPFVVLLLKENVKRTIIEFVLDLFLIQSLTPYAINLNGATWFLSCLAIIQLFIPLFVFLNNKIESKQNKTISLIKSITVFIILSLLMIFCKEQYTFPFYRIIHFLMGFICYDITKYINFKGKKLIGYLCFILLIAEYFNNSFKTGWFDIWASCLFVIFVYDIDMKLLENNFFMYLGKLSATTYLIHMTVNGIVSFVCKKIPIPNTNYQWMFVIIDLMAIYGLSIFFDWYNKHSKVNKVVVKGFDKVIGLLNK